MCSTSQPTQSSRGTLVIVQSSASTNVDYSPVSLIVSRGSVFASLYLDAASSRFDEVKETVMAGQYGKKAGLACGST